MAEMPSPNNDRYLKGEALAAALLQWIAGAGFLYLGHHWRFFAFILSVILFNILIYIDIGPVVGYVFYYYSIITLIILNVYFIFVDPIHLALRSKRKAGQWYQRISIYILVHLVFVSMGLISGKLISNFKLHLFQITGDSMAPSLIKGDYLLGTLGTGSAKSLRRGDIIIHHLPGDARIVYVTRIVGLPAETVQWIEGTVYINGVPLPTVDLNGHQGELARSKCVYGIAEIPADLSALFNTPLYTVPEGHVFVAGDNRKNSLDSRFKRFGTVPIEMILGHGQTIVWSKGISRIGLHLGCA